MDQAIINAMVWAHEQVVGRINQIEGSLAGGAYDAPSQPSLQRYGEELRKERDELSAHRDALSGAIGL